MRDTATDYSIARMRDQRDREITRRNQLGLQNFVRQAEIAAARHPEINPDVFHAIVDQYRAANPTVLREMIAAHNDGPLNPAQLNDALSTIRTTHYQRIRNTIRHNHGENGQRALEAIGHQLQPESLLAPITQMFYNGDRPNGRDGFQWGGMAVGGVGAAIGFYFTRGRSLLTQILGTVAGLIIGGFIGRQTADQPDRDHRHTPNFQAPRPVTTVPLPSGIVTTTRLHSTPAEAPTGGFSPSNTSVVRAADSPILPA